MIKMLACDLDGTLLNALHEVDGVIRRSIAELSDAGLHVVPATGRSALTSGKHGFEGIEVDAVLANGSLIRSAEGEVLKTFTIDPAFVEDLLRKFPQICFDCVTPEGLLCTGSREAHAAGFKKDGPVKRIIMRGMRARRGVGENRAFDQSIASVLSHDVCKINCRVVSNELGRELKAFLAERTDRVVNAPFNPVMFEITDAACNKGASVAWLAGHYGITEDEVAVYGDGGNDIVMLERFCHSYATANGSDAAKAAASEVIGPCARHSVPKHMLTTMRAQRSHIDIA